MQHVAVLPNASHCEDMFGAAYDGLPHFAAVHEDIRRKLALWLA